LLCFYINLNYWIYINIKKLRKWHAPLETKKNVCFIWTSRPSFTVWHDMTVKVYETNMSLNRPQKNLFQKTSHRDLKRIKHNCFSISKLLYYRRSLYFLIPLRVQNQKVTLIDLFETQKIVSEEVLTVYIRKKSGVFEYRKWSIYDCSFLPFCVSRKNILQSFLVLFRAFLFE